MDLSKNATGWFVDGPGRPYSGTFRGAAASRGPGAAGAAFNDWLSEIIDIYSPEIIGIEAPAVAGGGIVMSEDEAMVLIGLAFMSATLATINGIRFERRHVATVRKHLLGHGRPPNAKQAVKARCELLGYPVKTFDEADAAALWDLLKATYDKGFQSGTPLFAGAGAAT